MTHHWIYLAFTIILLFPLGSFATAYEPGCLLDSSEEFNLSEPAVDDSRGSREKSDGKISAASEGQSPAGSVSGTSDQLKTDSPGTSDSGNGGADSIGLKSLPPKGQPPVSRRGMTRSSEIAVAEPVKFELLEFDASAEPYFSHAVPRTIPIANDASLNDVCCVGPLTWAAGERGVICFSDDAGETWTTRITPFECSLKSVCFLTNTIGWVAGSRTRPGTSSQSSAVLLHTRDGGRTWTDLAVSVGPVAVGTSHLPASMLSGIIHIQYFGLENAVAVTVPMRHRGGHSIFRSTDGGRTWSPIPSDQSGGPWLAGQFLSESDGIVVGKHQSYAAVVADQAVVINRPEPTLQAIRGVSLDASAGGWIAGDGSFLLMTDDAGVTWRPPAGRIPREVTEMVDFHVVAHEGSTILVGGNPGACLLRSSDNGGSWNLVPLPLTGCLKRLSFRNADEVIGVGSLGQIVRSSDGGISWTSVRSTGFRTGLLNLITDADKAAWQLLSSASGEYGVRSVAIQISQPLGPDADSSADGVPMSDISTTAVTWLGGNDAGSHWMFPRTKPEHHRSSERLLAAWNQQTDGRLQKLLPLRIARDIRNWRPSVLVIEPASDDDAIAAVLRDVVLHAISTAADDTADGRQLSQLGLSPWKVDRVVGRVPHSQTATVAFRDDDLLPSLGTTSGLLHDATLKLFERPVNKVVSPDVTAGYELISDASSAPSIATLFEGIDNVLKSDARRPYNIRSREQIGSLKNTLKRAHAESTAINGNMRSTQTEDALIAQLYGIGAGLPATLAIRQLKELADINLQQNNMEGFLAVQQEIIRRYPASEEARSAAEMLFLFYSSAEARHFRLGASRQKTVALKNTSSVTPDRAASPFTVQPKVQAVVASPFSSGAAKAGEALHQRWDEHAMTAFRILSNDARGSVKSNPLVQLRAAANYRLQQKSGEQSTALSEISQRDDQYGLFARCEMQTAYMPATPLLPLLNLPKRSERPFLDGVLTDTIWEDAEEILLTPFVRDSLEPATGTRRKSLSNGADVSSLTMLAWDDEFLYLAARFQRAPEKSNRIELAVHRSYDEQHESNDRLELEIDTDRDFVTSFQFTVDESGRTSDRCWMLDEWNPEWFVALDVDAATWRVEAAIPLKEMSASGVKPGDLWNIRLRRIIPGVLQHELQSGTNPVSTDGTGMLRFIRSRRKTASSTQ